MLEEPGVLGGEHGAGDVAGNAVERHRAAFEQVGTVEAREQRRLEVGLDHRPLVDQDPLDPAARELDDEEPAAGRVGRRRATSDRDRVAARPIGPGGQSAGARRSVVERFESRAERGGRERLARREPERAGIETRRLLLRQGAEAPRELPVGPDARRHDRERDQPDGGEGPGEPMVATPKGLRPARDSLLAALRHRAILLAPAPPARVSDDGTGASS